MKFWPGKRDGPARIGYLEIKKKKITTPNIVFIDTSRFKAPKFADITIANNSRDTEFPTIYFSEKNKNNTKEKNSDFICLVRPDEDYSIRKNNNLDEKTIFVISNAKQLFNKPKKFLHSIIMLREKIGYQNVIYLPSTGTPQDLSLLTYLGIDLFDSTPAIVAARNDIIFFENGCYDKYKIAEIPCNCPNCSNVDKTPKNLDFKEILNHNYFELIKEIRQIRNAITMGEIRNLVEIRVRSSPHNTAILKNLDQIYYEFLEKRAPITSKGRINHLGTWQKRRRRKRNATRTPTCRPDTARMCKVPVRFKLANNSSDKSVRSPNSIAVYSVACLPKRSLHLVITDSLI